MIFSTHTPPQTQNYGAIYADAAWKYENWSAKGEGRNATSHYDCMPFEDLARLPIASCAARDCVLFLWVTDPLLPKGIELIERWGFEYKTVGFCWAKLNKTPKAKSPYFMGTGYWTRSNPELCLLATRGRPKRISKSVRRLVVEPRREHSRKPDCIRDHIEQLVAGPYLELFARETTPGWDCWGNQADLFDQGPVETRQRPSGRPSTERLANGPENG